MRKNTNLLFVCISIGCICCTGCHVYKASYVHPMYGGSTPYHSMPLKSDSMHTALYGSLSLVAGGANDLLRDGQFHFKGNVYQAHQFSFFHAYYGINASLGNYKVKPYHVIRTEAEIDTTLINRLAGSKFTGAWGLTGGFTFTLPAENIGRYGGEWRILGIHGSYQHEFGDYLAFRRYIDTPHVTFVTHDSKLSTIGFSTELAIKTRKGSVNVLLQYNILTGREYSYKSNNYYYDRVHRLGYFTPACQLNFGRYSPYVQFNFGTRYMFSATFGLNYRINGIYRK
ncbi:MAG: hypothetical protein KF862_12035 [Chitinophagaceae bacterium]|nr:hypothetical protein [Chitinophagaceae bacterium]